LSTVDGVETPVAAPTTTRSSWFVYVVRLESRIDRAVVIERLRARGIPSRPYFPPIHLQPHYCQAFGHRAGDLPVTEREAARTLALPFHANLPEADIDRVCGALALAVR
jgi:perosamine synthetase